MKNKGIVLIVAGAIGAAGIILYDPLMRKPVNDFTGPISTPALVICAALVITGVLLQFKNKPAPKKQSS